jgi:hypothetical protein
VISSKEIQAENQKNGITHASELESALQGAQDLVRKHFRGISNLHIEEVVDPETGERFSEVVFNTKARGEELMSAYDALTAEWVDSFPDPLRMHIRFIFIVI